VPSPPGAADIAAAADGEEKEYIKARKVESQEREVHKGKEKGCTDAREKEEWHTSASYP
jgi:hypothetical protein